MDAETFTIVVVDDEEMVLKSLESFLKLATDYRVVVFTSPATALDYIKTSEIDIVVSDYLMPDMDGLTFLDHVKAIKPEVPRIILTGYADKENAIKAINDVGLFQYIEKPWNNDDLLIILRNGIAKKQLVKKLAEKVTEIDNAYGELKEIQKEILSIFA
jgi:DNA-binding NtrC family response regulator